jgi:hypothetical protein
MPQDEPGLFRTFASIEPSPEGILAFVRRYGNLTHACPILVWQEEVLAMRRALRVWDLLREHDLPQLRKHFSWRKVTEEMAAASPRRHLGIIYKGLILVYDGHPDTPAGHCPHYPDRRAREPVSWLELRPLEQGRLGPEECDRLIAEPDPAAFARGYLRQAISDRISKHAESSLCWTGTDTLSRFLQARNLLGALWLQFEEGITGRKEYKPCGCRGCGRWIEILPAPGQGKKRFCSDNCRVKAFQARKKAGEQAVDGASRGKEEKRNGKKKGTR